MEFGIEIAKAIAELGVLVVIAGLFLWRSIKTEKKYEENTQQMLDILLEQLKTQGNVHVLTEEEDREAIIIDKAINAHLQDAVHDLKASRVVLTRYHNGGKDMSAISFLKTSVTNEAVGRGYKSILREFQNVFRSFMSYVCDRVDENGTCNILNTDSIKEVSPGMYDLLKSHNVRSLYCHSVCNVNDYPIGIVMISYTEDNRIKEEPERVIRYNEVLANKMSALLAVDMDEITN